MFVSRNCEPSYLEIVKQFLEIRGKFCDVSVTFGRGANNGLRIASKSYGIKTVNEHDMVLDVIPVLDLDAIP